MQRNNDSKKCSGGCDSRRRCYISEDGKYLYYVTIDLDPRNSATLRYEIGKDCITEELTFMIDDMNCEMDVITELGAGEKNL